MVMVGFVPVTRGKKFFTERLEALSYYDEYLFLPCAEGGWFAEVLFCGGDAAAAFADVFGVFHQMGIAVGVVFMQVRLVQAAEVLLMAVGFAWFHG